MERRPLFLGPKKYGTLNNSTSDRENNAKEEASEGETAQWKTVVGALISMFVAEAIKNSVKYAQDELSVAVHQPLEAIEAISDIQMICFILSAPVAGLIANFKSSQAVIIIGGLLMFLGIIITSFAGDYLLLLLGISVLFGIGYTFVLIGSFTIANEATSSSRHISTSLVICALVLGHTCPDVIYTSMLSSWQWRVMFRVLAVASLISVGAAGSVEVIKVENGNQDKDVTNLDGIKILVYLFIIVADALMFLGSMIAYHKMIEIQTMLHLSPNILFITFLTSLTIVGILCDLHTDQPLIILRDSTLLASCLPFILVFSDNTGIFLTPAILLTSLISTWTVSSIPNLATILGVSNLGVSLGLMASTRGVAYLQCPWMEQTLVSLVWSGSGVAMMMAGVLYALAAKMIKRKSDGKALYQDI